MKIENTCDLGLAVLNALGISSERVTGFTLHFDADGLPMATIQRHIPTEDACQLVAMVEKYRVVPDESFRVESALLTEAPRTSHLNPADSHGSPV